MAEPIRFDDSAAYEQSIGAWSRMTGDAFLAWLAPASGQRWLDVGCGTGAFSARIVQRAPPAEVQGIDLSVAHDLRTTGCLQGPAHFCVAMSWRCRITTRSSISRSWRWCSSSSPILPRASLK